MTKQLIVTFEGPQIEADGVPVDAFLTTLKGIQGALRVMVERLGERPHRRGKPPNWALRQSALRLTATRPGSLVAELALDKTHDGQAPLENYGEQALNALLNQNGSGESTLPNEVRAKLEAIPRALPEGMRLWIGAMDEPRKVEIKRRERPTQRGPGREEALLYGWLNAVNWDKHTAQLHRSGEGYVKLSFNPSLEDEMRHLATQFVEVRGHGGFNKYGDWTTVLVYQIEGTRSWREPFDMERFLNNPNPKIFDPDKMVTIELSDEEWESFNRAIREGRDSDG